jgi:D-arabinose 1-dehydrogenase-like Zn-dependent alcohol dehydrogenase
LTAIPNGWSPCARWASPSPSRQGIDLQFYCNADADPDAQQAHLRALCPHGYDHIMLLASSAEAVALTYPLLTDGGVLNLFAGIPKGQKAPLDLTPLASRHMRIVGSSGSTMDDIAECLRLVAEGALPARKVIGAIARAERAARSPASRAEPPLPWQGGRLPAAARPAPDGAN